MTYVQAHTDRQPTPNRRVWLLTLLAGVHVSPPKSHTSHVTVEQEVECVVWWHKTGHYVFFWKSSLKRGRFKVCVSLWVVPFFNVFSKYCFLYNKATKPVTLSHLKHNNSWHSCLKSQSVLCSWFLLSSPFFSAHAPCTSIFLSFFPHSPPTVFPLGPPLLSRWVSRTCMHDYVCACVWWEAASWQKRST